MNVAEVEFLQWDPAGRWFTTNMMVAYFDIQDAIKEWREAGTNNGQPPRLVHWKVKLKGVWLCDRS